MESPLILVIDDSPTIRKMVECHLSQAGYRVSLAPDAERGLEAAASIRPDLILLDHQLPGTTGEEVCKRLLQSEHTARVPVLISSAMRNRAFARYAEFTNVIDQIPKPFTPELLKSGVANALQMGAIVVQAQRTGCAMPEAVNEDGQAALEGLTSAFPVRSVIDFLNHAQAEGRLTLELGKNRIRFALGGGRLQAVYAPTVPPEEVAAFLPTELADLAPLLAATLGEHQDASMSGLVRLLERSLSDPRRLRTLLRVQAAVLTYQTLTADPGHFAFEAGGVLPPMFRAFPLQISLPALAVEGVRRCVPPVELERLAGCRFARQAARGGNVDRAGLAPAELRVHSLLDGNEPLSAIAPRAGLGVGEVAAVALGFELSGQAERRSAASGVSILLLEEDTETIRVVQNALGAEGEGLQVRHVRDRVAAQLLLRRTPFAVVMLPLDHADQEAFYHGIKGIAGERTRFIGLLRIEEESQYERLDALGLDGVLCRPVSESDLRSTIRNLIAEPVAVAT